MKRHVVRNVYNALVTSTAMSNRLLPCALLSADWLTGTGAAHALYLTVCTRCSHCSVPFRVWGSPRSWSRVASKASRTFSTASNPLLNPSPRRRFTLDRSRNNGIQWLWYPPYLCQPRSSRTNRGNMP